ncbi:MAG TPA: 6-hydroxymethylpterin diphosphokinase MptE-like protein [Treponemataceae bacterium]|nr:6-hydroxymethylpterin diphosphokinase MptE-like protein [Treponemataceae bacterium]
MDLIKIEPCLVPAGQGFSVLYKNRYLFSKYSPERAINQIVEQLEIRAGTLFLVFSPILDFPLQILLKKLKECTPDIQKSCCILAVEHDKTLFDFSTSKAAFFSIPSQTPLEYIYAQSPKDVSIFIHYAQENGVFPAKGMLRRALRIDASAAVQSNTPFYAQAHLYTDDLIAGFWKNRITLSHLGKLFTTNMFKNVALLGKSVLLSQNEITKPIIICAAGCSLDNTLTCLQTDFVTNTSGALQRKNVFIIAVDVTLIPLLQRDIVPDAVISMEAQLAIEQSYIGKHYLLDKLSTHAAMKGNPSYIHYICDISSRNAVARNFSKSSQSIVSFFMSKYCKESFMQRVEHTKRVQPIIPPLGSVGLVAVEIALYLKAPSVPIYISGLDFSYPAGSTHCKSTPAYNQTIHSHTRLQPHGSPVAAYKESAQLLHNTFYTDKTLSGYGRLFAERFAHIPYIYTLEDSGYPLGLKKKTIVDIRTYTQKNKVPIRSKKLHINPDAYADTIMLQTFYKTEQERLLKIKKILTNEFKTPLATDTKKELLRLINDCSYVYLHFPDGYKKAQPDQDFLNRVRAGLDFYLKITTMRQ